MTINQKRLAFIRMAEQLAACAKCQMEMSDENFIQRFSVTRNRLNLL